ncbi:hypothetical protein LX36DRAFT_714355 [Colletotrichum falcatum]|nr:hypothetical protein LX36DRAFT_714355 [Colletotrichum falcatum]
MGTAFDSPNAAPGGFVTTSKKTLFCPSPAMSLRVNATSEEPMAEMETDTAIRGVTLALISHLASTTHMREIVPSPSEIPTAFGANYIKNDGPDFWFATRPRADSLAGNRIPLIGLSSGIGATGWRPSPQRPASPRGRSSNVSLVGGSQARRQPSAPGISAYGCAFPDDSGFLFGCPVHNSMSHAFDDCPDLHQLPDYEILWFLVTLRGNKAPIRTTMSWSSSLTLAINDGTWTGYPDALPHTHSLVLEFNKTTAERSTTPAPRQE